MTTTLVEPKLVRGGRAGHATLVELLEDRAARAPEATPYIFLEGGDDDARSLTAGDLRARAAAIGAAILEAGTRPGDRVLLVMPPGLDYIAAFFGCLYAGVIAVPAYPPDPRRLARTLPRLVSIVEDCAARTLVSTPSIASLVPTIPQLASLRAVAVDDAMHADASVTVDDATRIDAPRVTVAPDTIAMLQYTSGSTTTPRGVILDHAALLANLAAMSTAFGLGDRPPPRVVSWLPPFHDRGLIGAILIALYTGGTTIAMSPLHFLQRPARWLRAISKYRADISGGPNFAYDLCTRKVDLATEQLDLSSWDVAFNGAEVVRASTLARFAEKFAAVGFRRSSLFPCYGLAETCLLATGAQRGSGPTVIEVDRAALERGEVRAGDDRVADTRDRGWAGDRGSLDVVSSGRAPTTVDIAIVDPGACVALAEGRVGEIWIAGPSIGRGYWGLEDNSQRVFRARTADGRGPYLRTGDLGFLLDGELFVSGRIKDMIIVHGRKLFPDDIERVVGDAHSAVRPGATAALAIDDGDGERLAIVQEVEGEHDPAAVRAAITRVIVEAFDVSPHAIVLVERGTIPKTSSGKIQRHACRALAQSISR